AAAQGRRHPLQIGQLPLRRQWPRGGNGRAGGLREGAGARRDRPRARHAPGRRGRVGAGARGRADDGVQGIRRRPRAHLPRAPEPVGSDPRRGDGRRQARDPQGELKARAGACPAPHLPLPQSAGHCPAPSFPVFEESLPMKSLCVYCGSNSGAHPAYIKCAIALGTRMARDGIRLVYGGGNIGLMGTIADAVLAAGGEVVGVIPKHLVDMEVAHGGLTELEVVDSMHQRKSRMFDLSDAFVAMPGGFGTLEEIVEMFTWRQLGISEKPCALLDINGYYQPLVAMMDRMVEERFLHPGQREDMWTGDNIDAMFEWMRGYQPAQASKWLDEKRSRELR